jgi:hypothetical protein
MLNSLVYRLDEVGKPAWIGLMVISFILFWPVGLAVLFYLFWSGRMACWKHERMGERMSRWHERHHDGERHDRSKDMFRRWMGKAPSTGNRAFDEYRDETLRRLEEEQKEFRDFLDKLRHAKDKAEFDQFMSDRRTRPSEPPSEQTT